MKRKEPPDCTATTKTAIVVRNLAKIGLRVGFWQNGFLADLIFEHPDFVADFVAGFFLLIFVGKKCPEKSSRKIPDKILQILYNKNPRQFSTEGPGQQVWLAKTYNLGLS